MKPRQHWECNAVLAVGLERTAHEMRVHLPQPSAHGRQMVCCVAEAGAARVTDH
jgi:hypothetical protein